MKTFISLFLLFALVGCNFQGQRMRRKAEPIQDQSRRANDQVLNIGTYEEIKKNLYQHAPAPHTIINREGTINFVLDRQHYRFDFSYSYTNEQNWKWVFNDIKTGERIASLHHNDLGLTYQHVRAQSFIQGDAQNVWEKLEKMSWQKNLQASYKLLTYQSFNPAHDWSVEKDGLKYFIITRVNRSQEKQVKEQLYLHKKRRLIGRILKNTTDENIIEDIRFSSYKEFGKTLLPTSIRLDRAWLHEKVTIHAKKTWLTQDSLNAGEFQKLERH